MAEEQMQGTAQGSQETLAETKQETTSDPSLLQEIMAKKAKIKEQDGIIAQYKAEKEKGRQKSMEEQGQLKELVAELKSSNEKLLSENEVANKIIVQQKVDIINSITSDDAKREELATKDIETLRFIQNELGNKTVNNPQESLGSVRPSNSAYKDFTKLSDEEKRDHWPEIVNAHKQ